MDGPDSVARVPERLRNSICIATADPQKKRAAPSLLLRGPHRPQAENRAACLFHRLDGIRELLILTAELEVDSNARLFTPGHALQESGQEVGFRNDADEIPFVRDDWQATDLVLEQ
jgi:hypothetical protein